MLRRSRQQEAPFRERDAYERLHGQRSGDIVRVITVGKPEPAAPQNGTHNGAKNGAQNGDLTGEHLRRAFETKLDRRD